NRRGAGRNISSTAQLAITEGRRTGTMSSNTRQKSKTQQQLSLLAQFKDIKPKGGLPVFKFDEVGTAITARFIRKPDGIPTKLDNDAAVVDVDIIECSDEITHGEHTIFLSTHLKKIFDEYQFSHGDRFVLKLCEIDEQTGFKRFASELIRQDGPRADDDDVR